MVFAPTQIKPCQRLQHCVELPIRSPAPGQCSRVHASESWERGAVAGFTDWQYRLLGPPKDLNLQSPSDFYTHCRAICFPDHSVSFQNPVYPGSRPILLYLPLQTHSTTLQNLTPMYFSSMNFLCTCYIVVDKIHIHSHFLLSSFQCCRSWTAKNRISASLAAR